MIRDPYARATEIAARRVAAFDFDGTLADTIGPAGKAAERAMLLAGMTPEQIGDASRVVGPPWPGGFMEIYGMSAEEAQRITDIAKTVQAETDATGAAIFPGMVDLIDDLRASGKLVGVITSRATEHVRAIIEKTELKGHLDFTYGQGATMAASKAVAFGHALEGLEIGPEEIFMVGDHRYDVEAAHTNGAPCIGVTYGGGTAEELTEAGAEIIVDSVADLRELLLGE